MRHVAYIRYYSPLFAIFLYAFFYVHPLRKHAHDMKIRLKPLLWEKDMDKEGLCPIAIRITGGNKVLYHNTGIKVPVKAWDGQGITKAVENHDIKNARLTKLVKDVEREILNRELQEQEINADIVKSLFRATPTKGRSYYTYAEKVIAGKKGPTKRRYTVELDKVKKFAGNSLMFGEITPKWLTAYHKDLLIKNQPNTAINAFKVIRHVFNEAIESGVINKDMSPFPNWKYPTYKAPVRQFLTLEECDRLFGLLDKKIGDDVKLVAAFFLLECFSGIRVSDWGKFKIETIAKTAEMIFTTTKTNTSVRLPLDLMPSLSRVIKYITDNNLKYNMSGAHANLMLKLIAPLADIDKTLTTHIARHTFATLSLSIGMSKEAIGMAMGITSRQVDTYAKLSSDKLRNELTRIGGGL